MKPGCYLLAADLNESEFNACYSPSLIYRKQFIKLFFESPAVYVEPASR